MTMNKKEKKLIYDLKIKAALRWTDEIKPDMPVPTGSDILSGYFYNAYSYLVTKGCSSSVSHSTNNDKKTTSQNGVAMYSSKALAMKAMRYDVALKAAVELKKIDDLIESDNHDE